jgi:4-hydroxy-2-oxoheptanedioate aldolase
VITRLLGSAPLDFVFFCNEHMPMDRSETSVLCQHFGSMGISPIVRIPSPDTTEAAKALDAGAEGIVVPYIETVEEVRKMVGAVHYRPIKGRQLRELRASPRRPAPATETFLRRFNRHHYLIIGIESVAAYENLDALIGVEGVDGVFMGPHDLSVSLDVPEQWEHPDLLHLIEDTTRRCRAAGIGVGVHLSYIFSLAQTHRFTSLGMNWILDGADIAHVLQSLRQRRDAICGPAIAGPVAANGESGCLAPDQAASIPPR